jgi:hypothetical protein
MTTYEQLKKIIVEAVPEIIVNKNAHLITFNGEIKYFEQTRPITLEDVIIVLGKKADKYYGKEYPTGSYWLGAMILNILSNYYLGKPLQSQSKETQKAILEIIK